MLVKNIWQWYYYSTSLTILLCLERYWFKESLVTSEQNSGESFNSRKLPLIWRLNMTQKSDFFVRTHFLHINIHQIDSYVVHIFQKNLVYVLNRNSMNQWMRICFSRERRGHINCFTPTKNFAQACARSLHHSPFLCTARFHDLSFCILEAM